MTDEELREMAEDMIRDNGSPVHGLDSEGLVSEMVAAMKTFHELGREGEIARREKQHRYPHERVIDALEQRVFQLQTRAEAAENMLESTNADFHRVNNWRSKWKPFVDAGLRRKAVAVHWLGNPMPAGSLYTATEDVWNALWAIADDEIPSPAAVPSGFVPFPDDKDPHFNGRVRCDMLVGPCCCGAWHKESEEA